ncbi:Kelch repeat-containing protein [Balneola sp. MJW-20]|uniref:Kelch repeat-containing protein n=1 Tax=Gracilimonas aurantiaca TaxID=3234185 RepID=UPI003466C934
MNKLIAFMALVFMVTACSDTAPEVKIQWTEVTELPQAISNNAVAAATVDGDQFLYTFMGLQRGKSFRDVSSYAASYNVSSEVWKQIPSVPDSVGRLASTAEYVNGYIYIFGGYTVAEDGSEKSTPEVWKFDPNTNAYEQVDDMLVSVDDAVSLVYNDRYIYLVSGWNDTNSVSNVQVYDTVDDAWETATPYPGPAVFGHSGGIVGNTMILSDGVELQQEGDERSFIMSAGSVKGVINPEDPTDITWNRIQQHPGAARYRMAAVGIESPAPMVVFMGGTDNPYNYNGIGYNSRPSSPLAGVFGYNINSGEWVELGEMPSPVMDLRGVAKTGDAYYLIGGMDAEQRVSNKVQKFTLQ